ncbi:SIR2 family protein [Frondihabitans sp. 4ASC-45]|uniref:SIR2 family protein n=1 Tax=Frondihabitans sp. 4ASC-45 TaxID=3111636 RepID=UPI003C225CEB
MVGYVADSGQNPLSAVNIERLVSAVRLLQNRETHEAAPFVGTWKQGALGFGPQARRGTGNRRLKDSVSDILVGKPFSDQRLHDVIADIARDVTSGSPDVFLQVETEILKGIKRNLGSPEDVSYLASIADLSREQRGVDVVTLNYDTTVEMACASVGVDVDTGIDRYRPGVPLRFDRRDSVVNLYKLHGSLTWTTQPETSNGRVGQQSRRSSTLAPEIRVVDVTGDELPWIVVGDREKLSTDGPTLSLMRAAEEALNRNDNLVVVGYSFSDAHINQLIRNWMLSDDGRSLVVLEPHWAVSNSGEDTGVRYDFLKEYNGSPRGREMASAKRRFTPVEGYAASSLAIALRARPEEDPTIWLTASRDASTENKIIVRNVGPRLDRIQIFGRESQTNRTVSMASSFEASQHLGPPSNYASSASFDALEPGESVAVYGPTQMTDPVAGLQIYAATIIRDSEFEVPVEAPRSD